MKAATMLALLWVGLLSYIPRANGSPTTMSSQEIFKKCAGAVVTIETPTKTGTGFFYAASLYTAFHVLDGASTATITFPTGQKASVTGALVADRVKDYAILQIDPRAASGPIWYGLSLGDYAALEPGERVTVIGSPRGLAQTVTEGIVSAKRRDGSRQLLQLSAGISPGSSGSPVFNAHGEVVGMVVETMEGGQTLNFAVSSADLKGLTGIPLSRAFAEPAASAAPATSAAQTTSTAGGPGSALCFRSDPRHRDLYDHSASGYVGLKGVTVYAGEVPVVLAGVVSTDDLRQWLAGTLDKGGIKVLTKDEYNRRVAASPASPSDIDQLRWGDDTFDGVDVSLAAVRSADGSVSFSYELHVDRAAIIMPGWMDVVRVDTIGGVSCLGAARNMKEDIRQTITQAAAQIVSRYQYANRPGDTSGTNDPGSAGTSNQTELSQEQLSRLEGSGWTLDAPTSAGDRSVEGWITNHSDFTITRLSVRMRVIRSGEEVASVPITQAVLGPITPGEKAIFLGMLKVPDGISLDASSTLRFTIEGATAG